MQPIILLLENTEMKLLRNIQNALIYAVTAIKNRYPCKIDTFHLFTKSKPTEIEYRVLNRFDARTSSIHDIVLNNSLLEKFHPSDALKLGVILAGDMLFKDNGSITYEELHEKYKLFCAEILGTEEK